MSSNLEYLKFQEALNKALASNKTLTDKIFSASKKGSKQRRRDIKLINSLLTSQLKTYKSLNSALTGFSKSAKTSTNQGEKAFSGMAKGVDILKTSLAGLSLYLGYELANQIKNSIPEGMEFSKQMEIVRQVSQATAEDFNKLKTSAEKLGKNTRSTAVDIAGLQVELAKLGKTSDEIVSSTGSINALATTFNYDLAKTAETSARFAGVFGITIPRMVDIMGKSFSTSVMDLDRFDKSMSSAAQSSKAFGLTAEQTVALLSKMVESGADINDVGDSLSKALAALKGTGGVSKFMGGASSDWDSLVKNLKLAKERGNDFTDSFQKHYGTSILMEAQIKKAVLAMVASADGLDDFNKALVNSDGIVSKMEKGSLKEISAQFELLKSTLWGFRNTNFFQHIEKSLMFLIKLTNSFFSALTPVKSNLKTIQTLTEKQKISYEILTQTYWDLRDKINKTNAETELYKETIGKLQKEYPKYLKNIDLEKDGINLVKIALQSTNRELEESIILKMKNAESTDILEKQVRLRIKEKETIKEIQRLEYELKNNNREAMPAIYDAFGNLTNAEDMISTGDELASFRKRLEGIRGEQNLLDNTLLKVTDKYSNLIKTQKVENTLLVKNGKELKQVQNAYKGLFQGDFKGFFDTILRIKKVSKTDDSNLKKVKFLTSEEIKEKQKLAEFNYLKAKQESEADLSNIQKKKAVHETYAKWQKSMNLLTWENAQRYLSKEMAALKNKNTELKKEKDIRNDTFKALIAKQERLQKASALNINTNKSVSSELAKFKTDSDLEISIAKLKYEQLNGNLEGFKNQELEILKKYEDKKNTLKNNLNTLLLQNEVAKNNIFKDSFAQRMNNFDLQQAELKSKYDQNLITEEEYNSSLSVITAKRRESEIIEQTKYFQVLTSGYDNFFSNILNLNMTFEERLKSIGSSVLNTMKNMVAEYIKNQAILAIQSSLFGNPEDDKKALTDRESNRQTDIANEVKSIGIKTGAATASALGSLAIANLIYPAIAKAAAPAAALVSLASWGANSIPALAGMSAVAGLASGIASGVGSGSAGGAIGSIAGGGAKGLGDITYLIPGNPYYKATSSLSLPSSLIKLPANNKATDQLIFSSALENISKSYERSSKNLQQGLSQVSKNLKGDDINYFLDGEKIRRSTRKADIARQVF